ncbi:MAG: sulfatase-like hydrolase/transferase, partial [Planctomycetota bacterium]
MLLIVVDDLNTDVGFMDGGAHTPNLDALAARGVVFSDAHCNAPVCNPSRTSFLTGRLPASTGVLDNDTYFRRVDGGPGVLTIPEYFRRHGYRSIGAGKVFHSGHRPASHPHAKLLDRNRSWDEYAELSIGTPLPKPRPNKWHEGRVQTWMKNAFWWA